MKVPWRSEVPGGRDTLEVSGGKRYPRGRRAEVEGRGRRSCKEQDTLEVGLTWINLRGDFGQRGDPGRQEEKGVESHNEIPAIPWGREPCGARAGIEG